MIDIEARSKEIYDQAVKGQFNGDFYFGHEGPPKTIEDLQAAVKSAKFIPGPPSFMHDYSPPTRSYWTYRVGSLAGQLGQAQFHGPEEHRLQSIELLSQRLAESEKKLWEASKGQPTHQPMLMRRSANRKIEIHASDQVVVVGGRIGVYELQKALKEAGQCLPIPEAGERSWFASRVGNSLSDALAMNLPHPLEAQCGSWRDWILGMTVMLADGSIVKSGSQVVKSVAGYDAHKLFVGARGTLGFVVELILKTFPLSSLPHHDVEVRHPRYKYNGPRPPREIWIQRTRQSDFAKAIDAAGDQVLEIDRATSTLWAHVPYEAELERFPDDWVIRKGCLEKNLQLQNKTQLRFMKRAKEVFDPTDKFNPGEFGF